MVKAIRRLINRFLIRVGVKKRVQVELPVVRREWELPDVKPYLLFPESLQK